MPDSRFHARDVVRIEYANIDVLIVVVRLVLAELHFVQNELEAVVFAIGRR